MGFRYCAWALVTTFVGLVAVVAAAEPPSAAVKVEIKKGNDHSDQRRWRKAIAAYTAALRLEPKSSQALNGRAWAYANLMVLDPAIVDINKAIRLKPNDADLYLTRGTIFTLAFSDHNTAIADFDKAIKLNPRYANAYRRRGNTRVKNNDVADGLADLDRAVALDPNDAGLHADLGAAYLYLGSPEKALAEYDRALRQDPKCAQAYDGRASVTKSKHDWKKAIEDCNKALALAPNAPWFHYNRAQCYKMLGEYKRALEDLEQARSLDPESMVWNCQMGEVAELAGQPDEAIRYYTQAIAVDDRCDHAYESRAMVHASRGQLAKAEADRLKAMRIQLDFMATRGSGRASVDPSTRW